MNMCVCVAVFVSEQAANIQTNTVAAQNRKIWHTQTHVLLYRSTNDKGQELHQGHSELEMRFNPCMHTHTHTK